VLRCLSASALTHVHVALPLRLALLLALALACVFGRTTVAAAGEQRRAAPGAKPFLERAPEVLEDVLVGEVALREEGARHNA
jgi:hypothetical protein